MGFGQITFGGLASGLDTNSIISSLVALERRPIQLLESQKGETQSKLNLIGTFEGLVQSLQDKAQELIGGGFFSNTIAVGTEGVANFTLSAGAQSGAHTLEVTSLASADRYALSGATTITDPDATGLGTGDITFTYDGTDHTITIATGFDSLNEVANAINNDALAREDVTASVINVGTETSPDYELVIAGNDTGADFTIQNLTVDPAIDLQTGVGTAITDAANASVVIDGLTVARSTNTFSDVLPGVSFTVSKADANPGSPTASTTFTIDSDPEGIKENVKGFIDTYNEVMDFINQQSEYSEESGTGGDLFGDSALSTVRREVQDSLFNVPIATVTGDLEGYSTLSLVGIDIDSDGRLTMNETEFDEKLSDNLTKLADLFLADDPDVDNDEVGEGLLVRLDAKLEKLLNTHTPIDKSDPDPNNHGPFLDPNGDPITIDSLFSLRKDTLNKNIADINKEVERLEFSVEQFEESLVLRFANLEQIISGLNAQSSFLNSPNAFPSIG